MQANYYSRGLITVPNKKEIFAILSLYCADVFVLVWCNVYLQPADGGVA